MGVTVGVNGMSVVHKESRGVSIAPGPYFLPGPLPVVAPLPNLAESKNLQKGTKKVRCDGESVAIDGCVFSPSTLDQAARAGVLSNKTQGKAELVTFSGDVRVEGKGVGRALDMMTHNDKNTMVAPILQGPLVVPEGAPEEEDEACALCNKQHGAHHA